MGIPSYYKTLCDRIPGLLGKRISRPTHFWLDFNCMIYHCIRRPGVPVYNEDTRLQWENEIIEEVCKYTKKLVSIVQPTEQVYIGVDGVVPMAKIRQQRLRRFKSYWSTIEEEKLGIRTPGEAKWDTNAITPGTAFMERLGVALHKISSKDIKWIVSATDEPGEGEQKVVCEMKKVEGGTHVIYGLDADLIVLSLLQKHTIWLFREAMETGVKRTVATPSQQLSYKATGSLADGEEYSYFNIDTLREYLYKGREDSYGLDYCMGMSLLGNDFLPHSMTVKLKEGGHEVLLQMLLEVRKKGVLFEGGSWRKEALIECFAFLARYEEQNMEETIVSKLHQRYQRTRGATAKEHAQDEWNKTPLRVCDEIALMETSTKLRTDWRSVYYERYLGITTKDELDTVCKEYCTGLQWIGQYYLGGSVNLSWHFPWFLPPLWSDLEVWLNENSLPSSPIGGDTLKPQEQLSLVLPKQSYWLVRDSKLRQLPSKMPQYWPKEFELFTAGHKQMWECEAMIPILTPERLRYVLNTTT